MWVIMGNPNNKKSSSQELTMWGPFHIVPNRVWPPWYAQSASRHRCQELMTFPWATWGKTIQTHCIAHGFGSPKKQDVAWGTCWFMLILNGDSRLTSSCFSRLSCMVDLCVVSVGWMNVILHLAQIVGSSIIYLIKGFSEDLPHRGHRRAGKGCEVNVTWNEWNETTNLNGIPMDTIKLILTKFFATLGMLVGPTARIASVAVSFAVIRWSSKRRLHSAVSQQSWIPIEKGWKEYKRVTSTPCDGTTLFFLRLPVIMKSSRSSLSLSHCFGTQGQKELTKELRSGMWRW